MPTSSQEGSGSRHQEGDRSEQYGGHGRTAVADLSDGRRHPGQARQTRPEGTGRICWPISLRLAIRTLSRTLVKVTCALWRLVKRSRKGQVAR